MEKFIIMRVFSSNNNFKNSYNNPRASLSIDNLIKLSMVYNECAVHSMYIGIENFNAS